MGLRIWETDPEAAPKQRQRADIVGRFRSGYQVGGRPATLTEWRVTTGDPQVADAVRRLYGGEPAQTWETQGEDTLEVFTQAASVPIVLRGADAIRQEMVLWGRSGPIRRCDGVEQTMDQDKGRPCECPQSYQDRKDAAKAGRGCTPNITVFFTLRDAPELGVFKFASGSWSLLRDLVQGERELLAIDGPAFARLSLEVVEYESQGKTRKFTKPVIDTIHPAPKPDDEPPF